MCGILGCNYRSDNFKEALSLLRHRGPDYEDCFISERASLGHTRLAIIDLNQEANQPMEFDGLVLVFNGEIYNYKDLIKEHGLDVKTKSDSEVIIRMYQKYGKKSLKFFNGMFAFCIFDKKKKSFFCARDRFGKKPFFYYYKNGRFIFASEIKSILKILSYTPEVNIEGIYQYFRFSAPLYDNTAYMDIKKLPAGHMLELNGNLITEKYYDIDDVKIEVYDEKEALANIENLLIDSVRLRLVGDVEVASLLSGGIDSSLISALYSKIGGKKINTFSIGYDEYLHYSEVDYAKIVAKHINSQHHELIISKKEYLENINDVLDAVDEPFGDSATVPTLILSRFIHSKGIKVALSGEGSDENFLGYDNYFKMFEYDSLEVNSLEEFNLTKEWEYKKRKYKKQRVFYSTGETFSDEQLKKLFKRFSSTFLPYDCTYGFDRWVTYADFKYWIENVLMTKIDRASMANALEIRAPFLDYRLVEYVLGIDPEIKKGNTNKYLLKKIALKYLPEKIVFRRKKGFSSPFIEWLYDEYNEKLLKDILRVNSHTGFFDEDFIKFLYNEAKEKRFKQHFYNLYVFSVWFERVYL